ncbi:hypothetical protein L9F63_010482 [Diploptera punctata]|uniref:Alpha galactosidase A C-terminal domain-containing protein n=1 Tax=Diploptera punctata TaxID=6984 RepID=A0AAD8AHU0_DIPPU|nr:hypothetical protein L9F63_010482 [Diploptera punctata]
MAIWAILASPLIMSTELRDIKREYKDILQNKGVIAVNQDPLGIQGKRIYNEDDVEIWTRPVSPKVGNEYSYAVAIISRRTDGYPYPVSTVLQDIGLNNTSGYVFEDLYDSEATPQILSPDSELNVRVNPTGVVFFRATALDNTDL